MKFNQSKYTRCRHANYSLATLQLLYPVRRHLSELSNSSAVRKTGTDRCKKFQNHLPCFAFAFATILIRRDSQCQDNCIEPLTESFFPFNNHHLYLAFPFRGATPVVGRERFHCTGPQPCRLNRLVHS